MGRICREAKEISQLREDVERDPVLSFDVIMGTPRKCLKWV